MICWRCLSPFFESGVLSPSCPNSLSAIFSPSKNDIGHEIREAYRQDADRHFEDGVGHGHPYNDHPDNVGVEWVRGHLFGIGGRVMGTPDSGTPAIFRLDFVSFITLHTDNPSLV